MASMHSNRAIKLHVITGPGMHMIKHFIASFESSKAS